MINSIYIKNFKKIGEHGTTLNNLGRVNYLVGENGCGKSSILSAISYINDPSNARIFFNKKSKVKIMGDGDKSFELVWQDKSINPNNTSSINTGLLVNIIIPSGVLGFGANGIMTYGDNLGIGSSVQLDFLNSTLEDRGFKTRKGQKIVEDIDPFSSDIGRTVFKEGNIEVDPFYMSDGMKSILKMKKMFDLSSQGGNGVVILEEPENNLNPKFHKKIPGFVDLISKELKKNGFNSVQFFISTHSPFIISAAAELLDHKVYLIEDGNTRNLEGSNGEGSNGYSGYECKKVVNEMLGVGFDDFQNKIVVCEGDPEGKSNKNFDEEIYSIIFADFPVTFVSAGGGTMHKNVYVAKKIFENSIECIIKDGDGKSDEIQMREKNEYLENDIILNFLKRRDIEAYLFDYSIIERLFLSKGFNLDTEFNAEYCKYDILAHGNLKHVNSDQIITLIQQQLHSESGGEISSYPKKLIKKDLAQTIYKNRGDGGSIQEIYDELRSCILGLE